MAKHTVTLTVEQEAILQAIGIKTGRSVDELLFNYLDGFVGSLREQANTPVLEETFSKLTFEEKQSAINFITKGVIS